MLILGNVIMISQEVKEAINYPYLNKIYIISIEKWT